MAAKANIRLSAKLSTKQKITSAVRQSLELLSLNAVGLNDKLNSLIEENPFIEESRPAEPFESKLSSSNRLNNDEGFETYTRNQGSVQDYLIAQTHNLSLDKKLHDFIIIIISYLDASGFTTLPIEDIALENNFSTSDIIHVVKQLKQLEPLGVCAEDLWQSLEWQAEKLFPDNGDLLDIIYVLSQSKAALNKMNFKKEKELAELMSIEFSEFKKQLNILKKLDLHPGQSFVDDRNRRSNKAFPEIFFIEREGIIAIDIPKSLYPELSLNSDLFQQFNEFKDLSRAASTSNAKTQEEKEKWQTWYEKYKEADNIIKSISYRYDSISKLASIILIKQGQFFTQGPMHLLPLNQAEIAAEINVHVSTVSRIVSNKYCQCKWGVFSLKDFFPARIKSNSGLNLGSEDLKRAILAEIALEDRKHPHTDAKLVEILTSKGFDIKRRTIAKYRKLLHVPKAVDRKA